jgi:hypothetical protein
VRHQVEREIERRDTEDGTDGQSSADAHPFGSRRVRRSALSRPVKRQHASADSFGLLCGDTKSADRAPDFAVCVDEGLSCFERDAAGNVGPLLFQPMRYGCADFRALCRVESARLRKRVDGGCQRLFRIGFRCLANGCDDVAVEGCADIKDGLADTRCSSKKKGENSGGTLIACIFIVLFRHDLLRFYAEQRGAASQTVRRPKILAD